MNNRRIKGNFNRAVRAGFPSNPRPKNYHTLFKWM